MVFGLSQVHMQLNYCLVSKYRMQAVAVVAAGGGGLHDGFQDTPSTAPGAKGFSWVQRHKVTPLIPFSLAYSLQEA